MKKNTVFIICILSLLFSSCKNRIKEAEPGVYSLEVVKTFEILLDEQDRNLMMSDVPYRLIEVDKAPVFAINYYYKKLSFYDIESGVKINEIYTDSTRRLRSFQYINKDSIFCYYSGDFSNPDRINSNYGSLQLIDHYGNVKEKYKYNIDSIELKSWNLGIEKIVPPFNTESNIPMVGENAFFSTSEEITFIPGTEKFMKEPTPVLMRYDTREQKLHLSKHKNFPYIKEGIYYPTSFAHKNVCISGNDYPLIRFIYSSDVFEWDYKNDKLITHSLKSRLLDTIMPLEYPARESDNLKEAYHNIFYDKYSGLYYSYLTFMNDFYGTLPDGRSLSTIVIANKDFEYLGEIYCNNYYPGETFTKDYIVDYSFKNDSIVEIYYLKLVKTNRDYNNYIDSCRKDLESRRLRKQAVAKDYFYIKDYIIQFLKSCKEINTPEYTVLTIYAQSGCLGCTEYILNQISENRDIYENKPFYLIITANDAISAYRELKDYELENFKNLIIDSTGVIRNLTEHKGMLNPRLTLVENNEITLDTIYDSFDIYKELIPRIIKKVEEREVIIQSY